MPEEVDLVVEVVVQGRELLHQVQRAALAELAPAIYPAERQVSARLAAAVEPV